MCGIWASLGVVVDRVRIDRVAHRGPDGSGWRQFKSPWGPATLGHRRLAIIDTTDDGLQPMSEQWQRYWLTFNGEIYNYRELRSELETLGIVFFTQSDSEVLLQAFVAWGEVFRTAAEAGLKVMLDGQGADEVLAGYHWLFGPALADLLRRGKLLRAHQMIADRRTIHGAQPLAQIMQAAPHLLPAAWRASARRQHRASRGADWLDGAALRPYLEQLGPFEAAANELGLAERSDIGALCMNLTAATSLPMLLHWEDRSSMMHGVEARVPFLDHRLVEYAIGLGEHHKMRGAETKVLLRRAMADRLPSAVLNRQDKLGFATPEQEWARGPLRGYLRAGVEKTLDLYPTLLNRAATLAMVDATLNGNTAFSFKPWRIMMVGMWGERFRLTI